MRGGDVAFTGVTHRHARGRSRGDLFVALRGERFDGHDFVAQALRARRGRGAWSTTRRGGDRAAAAASSSTTRCVALGTLAAHWRARFALPLVASPAATARRR